MTRHNNATQPLKDFSTRELCALAARLNIKYCIKYFEKADVDGEEMVLYSKEEFVSMLKTSTGDICLLVPDFSLHYGLNLRFQTDSVCYNY